MRLPQPPSQKRFDLFFDTSTTTLTQSSAAQMRSRLSSFPRTTSTNAIADHQQHHADYDYARADVIVPHPVYAEPGWVSIVNPGPGTAAQILELLGCVLELATGRDKRRQRAGSDSRD